MYVGLRVERDGLLYEPNILLYITEKCFQQNAITFKV